MSYKTSVLDKVTHALNLLETILTALHQQGGSSDDLDLLIHPEMAEDVAAVIMSKRAGFYFNQLWEVKGPFRIMVDSGLSICQRLTQAGLEASHPESFEMAEGPCQGQQIKEVYVVYLDVKMHERDALNRLDRAGLENTKTEDLLAFYAQYPNERIWQLMGLGTKDEYGRYPCIIGNKKRLIALDLNYENCETMQFLVTKKG